MSTALAVVHAAQLVCVSAARERFKAGTAMQRLAIIEDGGLIAGDGKIDWVGPARQLPPLPPGTEVIDAAGKVVLPGLVDCHTHLLFAGDRVDEFEERLRGTSYAEIAARGGGINATVRRVRAASKEELKRLARRRLDRMLALGVTTVEVKSGYGLATADEIKCLEAIAELANEHPCDLVATFLGAHDVPPEYRRDRERYLEILVHEMIPEVAARRLASFCDVFCEQGVFSVEESGRILQAARDQGLGVKVHADELSPLGGAELAARMGAVSADHLLHVTERGVEALAASGTVAVLLPGTAFSLALPFAPARRLLAAGLPVALATDCNPGSSMTENLPLIGSMAAVQMRMLPAEVISALTLNAAAALGRNEQIGSLEPGKQADLAIFDVPDYRLIPYHYGVNHVWKVVKSGRVVVGS